MMLLQHVQKLFKTLYMLSTKIAKNEAKGDLISLKFYRKKRAVNAILENNVRVFSRLARFNSDNQRLFEEAIEKLKVVLSD